MLALPQLKALLKEHNLYRCYINKDEAIALWRKWRNRRFRGFGPSYICNNGKDCVFSAVLSVEIMLTFFYKKNFLNVNFKNFSKPPTSC